MDAILEDLEDDLISRAFLYENPGAYREGVEATLAAIRAMLASGGKVPATGAA